MRRRTRPLSIAIAAVLALGAAAAPAHLAVAGSSGPATGSDHRQSPPPRLYVITPSSSPETITSPSVLQVRDPRSHQVRQQMPTLGFKPHKFYPIPGRNIAYITHFGGAGTPQAIEVFDLVRNTITGLIPTGADGPRHLGFSPDFRHAYTANLDGDSITAIDVDAGRAVATVPVGKKPNYVNYVDTRAGARLFVVNFGADTMTVLDARTLQRIGTVTVGDGPYSLVATADGRQVITANARDNTITFVDSATLRVTGVVPIGGVHAPLPNNIQRLNIRLSPEGRWLWVGNQDASEMTVVDLRRRTVAARIPAGLGADIAFFPAAGPAKGYALITGRYDNLVTVAKLNGQRPPTYLTDFHLRARGTHFITFDEEYRRAFVSQRPGGAYSVLDLRTWSVIADSVPVGPSPEHAFYVWFDDGVARFHAEYATGGYQRGDGHPAD